MVECLKQCAGASKQEDQWAHACIFDLAYRMEPSMHGAEGWWHLIVLIVLIEIVLENCLICEWNDILVKNN